MEFSITRFLHKLKRFDNENKLTRRCVNYDTDYKIIQSQRHIQSHPITAIMPGREPKRRIS